MDRDQQDSLGWKFVSAVVALFVLGVVTTAGVIIAGYINPQSFKELGTWGDFTGGASQPHIDLYNLYWGFDYNSFTKKTELNLNRKEVSRSADALETQSTALAKQKFETTFFEMLKFQSEIVNSIDLANPQTKSII